MSDRPERGILLCLLLLIPFPLHLFAAEGEAEAVRVVHLIVPLCDNRNQGIVPVPEELGNGQDPARNLYWGALYGVKTFFRKAADWQAVEIRAAESGNPAVLDRVVYFHSGLKLYLAAEAYDGAKMAEALAAFLYPDPTRLTLADGTILRLGEAADLRAFAGHNGLMDAPFPKREARVGPEQKPAIILACYSRSHFGPYLESAGLEGLVLTRGLMAPEAYTLVAALEAWGRKETPLAVQRAAAQAYARYQRIKLSAAAALFAEPAPGE